MRSETYCELKALQLRREGDTLANWKWELRAQFARSEFNIENSCMSSPWAGHRPLSTDRQSGARTRDKA